MKKYPEELKRKVVPEYTTWEGSRGEFLAKCAIPNTTLHQWLHAYAKPLPAEEKQQAVRATHIDKLEAQLEKALTVVKILQISNLFTRATRREKLPHSYNRGKTPNESENEFFMHSKDIQA